MSSEKNTFTIRTPADLGLQIRAARKQQGLTQTELAELTGVGTRFISELERGKHTAQLGLSLELARMVGVDVLAQPRRLVADCRNQAEVSGQTQVITRG